MSLVGYDHDCFFRDIFCTILLDDFDNIVLWELVALPFIECGMGVVCHGLLFLFE